MSGDRGSRPLRRMDGVLPTGDRAHAAATGSYHSETIDVQQPPPASLSIPRAHQHLFRSHPLPMLVYDVETLAVLQVNDALVSAHGYTEAELLSMRITDLIPPEDVPALVRVVREALAPGHHPFRPPRLWRHVRRDGAIRDVEVSAHDYEVAGREAVLVSISDVTDQLRAERERDALLQQLAREAAEKAAILDQMTDAVLVADATGTVVLANRAAHALFEIPDGAPWPNMAAPDAPWRGYDADGRLTTPDERPFARAKLGESVRGEYRLQVASGHEAWIWVSAGPLRDDTGAIRGLVWVARETTEERLRREREARGEKLRALGQMAGGVAHDLNQYLGLVAGYGELAIRSLDGTPPHLGAARDALDVVVRAAMDGSEAVKRLLSFARPAQEGRAESIDLGELLREVAALTAPRWRDDAQQQGRPISMLVECIGDTAVSGWPALLREALTNLILNATDALPGGGTIRLGARREGDRVVVEVWDSGTGISAEALPHIFEPFFTTKGDRGTGLGLAIVYGIAERHQGTVSVSSALGRGTTVALDLPAARTAPAPAPKREVPGVITGLRILVVDDEPAIAKMVSMMLRPHGHTITTVTSGEEALADLVMAEQPYDLIISDLGLGAGMNGWELLDRIRARDPHTRFILSTGWGAQIEPADVQARGAESLLSKPYRLHDLLQAVAGPAAQA